MNRSHRDGMRPVVVDAFAADESPYGVRGMAGNSYDPCLNDVGPAYPTWRYFRGGAWGNAGIPLRAANTHGIDATTVYYYFGVRLSVRPVLS
jgi:serine/threonine-protein kinase